MTALHPRMSKEIEINVFSSFFIPNYGLNLKVFIVMLLQLLSKVMPSLGILWSRFISYSYVNYGPCSNYSY